MKWNEMLSSSNKVQWDATVKWSSRHESNRSANTITLHNRHISITTYPICTVSLIYNFQKKRSLWLCKNVFLSKMYFNTFMHKLFICISRYFRFSSFFFFYLKLHDVWILILSKHLNIKYLKCEWIVHEQGWNIQKEIFFNLPMTKNV